MDGGLTGFCPIIFFRPLHAFGFGVTCAVTGTAMLLCGVNGLSASLGLLNLFIYTSVYTPLKRVSIANTWFGSIGTIY
jgi:protoheme IX farnesyltransferase